MNPEEAYTRLRIAIPKRPELRYKRWPNVQEKITLDPYRGACYIATQVFCHLIPGSIPFSVGRSHFWAVYNGERYDPTWDQFDYEYPYNEGKRTKFKTFSARSRELLKECMSVHPPTLDRVGPITTES